MKFTHFVIYISQWIFYFARLLLYLAYGVLSFISKPGSRYILPVSLGAALYFYWSPLHAPAAEFLAILDDSFDPDAWLFDVLMVAGALLAVVAYVVVSRILAVVLGAFPTLTRPLRPLRRLRIAPVRVTPAVVRQVVPPLRRPRKLSPNNGVP